MEIIIAFVILVTTMVIGVPIPFAFAAAFIWISFSLGFEPDFLLSAGYGQISSVVLLAIPMFVLAGGVMERGRIGEHLIGLVEKFVGRFKGGLGAVAVITSAIFGSISGSAAATLSCIGSIMEPRMTKAGYKKGYTAALIANASPLGLLIPPSTAQILYAWSSGQSVLACFLATIIPGIILAFLLICVNVVLTRKMSITIPPKETPRAWVVDTRKKTVSALPALLMPAIILGSIYGGVLTPTEAAAVSVLYAIPVGLYIYRGLTWKDLKQALIDTSATTGVIMVMLFMIMILSRLLVMENVPTQIADALLSITENPVIILLMVNVFMIIIGMLMDDASGILLCTPILLPVVVALGVHPIHFAAILGVNLGMGLITPPTAPMLYLGCRVCKARVNDMLFPTMMFIIFAWLPTLLLTTFVPDLALTIPKMVLPKLFG